MVLLFDGYTDHNINSSPTPWQGKYLSTEKEVKFGNKSESDLFQENQKNIIHFCMTQREDIAWNFFGNKSSNQIGGLVRKLMEFGRRVFVTLSSLQMVVLFLCITIMWIATLVRYVKRQSGFITLSYSKFSIPSTKIFRRSISSMITIPCLSITAPTSQTPIWIALNFIVRFNTF